MVKVFDYFEIIFEIVELDLNNGTRNIYLVKIKKKEKLTDDEIKWLEEMKELDNEEKCSA